MPFLYRILILSLVVVPFISHAQVNNDLISTLEETAFGVLVTINDSHPDGIDPSTVDLDVTTTGRQITVNTASGTFSVDDFGFVMFTPLPDYNGTDMLEYSVATALGAEAGTAMITVEVTAVNDPPAAADDFGTTDRGIAATIDVIFNDIDVEGDLDPATVDLNPLLPAVQFSQDVAGGTFTSDGAGNVTFTPLGSFTGEASVTYTISDTDGAVSDNATISVTVNATNSPPVANNDNVSTNEDTNASFSLVANDTDDFDIAESTVDLDPITAGRQTSFTSNGTFTADNAGFVSYNPTPNFFGNATLNYTVMDNDGAVSDPAAVTVTVNSVNDSPIADDDTGATDEGVPVDVNVVSNDSDIDGTLDLAAIDLDVGTGGIQNVFSNTTGSYSVAGGVVTYTPAAGYSGVTSIPYTIRDADGGLSNEATLTITVNDVNNSPVAANDNATTSEDVSVNVTILGNDTDDDDIVETSVDLDPSTGGEQNSFTAAGGTFTVNALGVVNFVPVANYFGTATAQYTVNDNEGETSNTATITITVTSVNDLPVANDDSESTQENTAVNVDVVANDTDPDGTINAASVDLNTATAAIDDTRTTASGTYAVNSSGVVSFTPAANFTGNAILDYTVQDDSGGKSPAATITISVSNVNQEPVALDDNTTTNEDVSVNVTILANDTDDSDIVESSVDLDPSTGGEQNSFTAAGGTFTVNASGVVNFVPVANYFGTATAQYTVNDNGGETSNIATITITVTSVNDLPVANDDSESTQENTAVNVDVVANDTDPDGTINAASVDLNIGTAAIDDTRTTASGTYTVNSSGVVSFTPAANFTGNAILDYTVQDDSGGKSPAATITISVSNVNQEPVALDDNTTTNEDVSVNVTILANDTDDSDIVESSVDLDPSVAGTQNTFTGAGGTFSVNASGVVNFVPTANHHGSVTASYTVNDDEGLTSNAATITITMTPVNDPPIASNDAATTNEGIAVNVNLIANDTDVDGSVIGSTVDIDLSTAGVQNELTTTAGTFLVNSSGVLTFTPALNFSGGGSITYNVRDDGGALSNTATVTITVNSVNDTPVATNDVVSTNEDVSVSFNILTNDTDDGTIDAASTDLDPVTSGRQTSMTGGTGTFTIDNGGQLTYAPAPNFHGVATTSYTVEDEAGLVSNTATVSVTVASINDLPTAGNDVATTAEDTPAGISLLVNDNDTDGTLDPLTVDLDPGVGGIQTSRAATGGTYAVNTAGELAFSPSPNYNGTSSIQYTVSDNNGGLSNAATITITIMPANDPPVAVNDAATIDEGQATTINILANDSDDSAINTATVDLDPSSSGPQSSLVLPAGTLVVNSSGSLTYSPASNYNGVVIVNYTVNDNGGLTSNIATVSITVNSINIAPIATSDAASTNEDTPVTIHVTANDSDDVDIDETSVDLNTSTAGVQQTRSLDEGVFSADALGKVTFTPTPNFSGSVSISYLVRDSENAISNAATISVTVNPVNDQPIVVDDSKTTNEDTNVMINVLSNDSDPDGTLLASSLDLDPANGGVQSSVSIPAGTFSTNATGVITFIPVSNFFGTATSTYTITDNDGLISNVATITVTVVGVNDPPIANNDIANTNQGQTVSINLIANDIDVDGTINPASIDLDPAVVGRQITRAVASGSYTVDDAGVVTLVPIPTFSGNSSITYTVSDNTGTISNNATISVLVNFVNQKPVANNDAATTPEDTPVTFNVLTNDTDDGSLNTSTVDLNPVAGGIQASITSTEGTYTVNALGALTFTPSLNYNGTSNINYTVNDNIGEGSNIATITVTVTPTNDSPVAAGDAVSTPEDTPVVVNVVANDNDSDGTIDGSTVDIVPGTPAVDRTFTVALGTFSVNESTGHVTFTPLANVTGTANASYTVKDNSGAKSNTATIAVTVTNVNDPPTFDVIADQRVLKNSLQKTITISGITAGAGETEQVLITAISQNTTLVAHPSITYSGTGTTATLSYKPQLNQSGLADITVKIVDGGLNEFSRTFAITVVDVSITSTPVSLAIPGELYEYSLTTTDIPETLSLVAMQKPSWATLTSTGKNTAVLSGIPPTNATTENVLVELRDGATVIDEQQYELLINRRPVSAPFTLEVNEDVELLIGPEEIAASYSDVDLHSLAEIQITQLPRHGQLVLGGTPVSVLQILPTSLLSNLSYRPANNYHGPDTVYFKVSDSYAYSVDASYFNLIVTPVNDAPIITVLEDEPLVFDIGRELAQIFTVQFNAGDPDDDMIAGATIGFRLPNFDADHDVLNFSDTDKISGEYDEEVGTLRLTGSATVAEYVDAIRSITYNFVDLDEITLEPRTVYITISDGQVESQYKERIINLTYDFVELNIPNVFTPDNNGKNDFWKITSTTGLQQYGDAVIRVFDKRGVQVYHSIGFDTPWDGKAGGVALPADNYFYTVDLKYGKIKYTGSLLILREQR